MGAVQRGATFDLANFFAPATSRQMSIRSDHAALFAKEMRVHMEEKIFSAPARLGLVSAFVDISVVCRLDICES